MIQLQQKLLVRTDSLERPIIISTQSGQHTPTGNARWHLMTNNFVSLNLKGVWKLKGWITWGRTSGEVYNVAFAKWAGENGDNTANSPAGPLNGLINVNAVNLEMLKVTGADGWGSTITRMIDFYVNVPEAGQPVYLGVRSDDHNSAFANQRITVQITAEFLGKANLNGVDFGI